MRKIILSIIASMFVFTGPAMAQSEEHREHSAMQHIGGHWRHGHRDWPPGSQRLLGLGRGSGLGLELPLTKCGPQESLPAELASSQ